MDINHLCHLIWGGWGCEVSCGGHHRPRGKTTTGSALDWAVFDMAQILAYLVHNMLDIKRCVHCTLDLKLSFISSFALCLSKHGVVFRVVFSYIPSSAIRRSGSARYFSVRHYRIAEKFHNNDADSSRRSMFTFSRPITALLTGALAVQGHGQVTWPDTSICSFIG